MTHDDAKDMHALAVGAEQQPDNDKWERDELWHALAKANGTNAYLEARAPAAQALQGAAEPTSLAAHDSPNLRDNDSCGSSVIDKAVAVEPAMDALRRRCAVILREDPETWPRHGDAAKAIAAAMSLLAMTVRNAEEKRRAAAVEPAKVSEEKRNLKELVELYGDERSCVTYNGWARRRDPKEVLTEINEKIDRLAPEAAQATPAPVGEVDVTLTVIHHQHEVLDPSIDYSEKFSAWLDKQPHGTVVKLAAQPSGEEKQQ